MMITVVLCTYNRCQALAGALESVAASKVPNSVEWEILVVDNNSNDQTRAVVEGLASRHPGRFRYLFEGNPGKSQALNAGVTAARGEVLAFMDDDVTVDPCWLDAVTAPLRGVGEWSGAGGPVILCWSGPPPAWLDIQRPYSMGPLAGFDLGQQTTELDEPPFGTNMAFRKSMFKKYGLFRTDLGPSPRTDIPRPNEDTEFGRRLIAGGERLRYVPAAIVHHGVPEERLQKEYFLNWWYDKGRAEIRETGNPSGDISLRGVPLNLYRRIGVWTLRWIFGIGAAQRFDCKLKVWGKLGAIAESRLQFTHGRNPQTHSLAEKDAEKEKEQCETLV
ncbi:MAG TPA: glycosyltransferase family A protein [Candidatus Sulfotelmatobacter sp.]